MNKWIFLLIVGLVVSLGVTVAPKKLHAQVASESGGLTISDDGEPCWDESAITAASQGQGQAQGTRPPRTRGCTAATGQTVTCSNGAVMSCPNVTPFPCTSPAQCRCVCRCCGHDSTSCTNKVTMECW